MGMFEIYDNRFCQENHAGDTLEEAIEHALWRWPNPKLRSTLGLHVQENHPETGNFVKRHEIPLRSGQKADRVEKRG